eukprot:GHUV01055612.1.p1 GENE.GHUV01055612.1~~GHUV01055612.1.p1  ORF type:complete len:156 (+),score=13.26 GHUV01055612.1:124-591(+)
MTTELSLLVQFIQSHTLYLYSCMLVWMEHCSHTLGATSEACVVPNKMVHATYCLSAYTLHWLPDVSQIAPKWQQVSWETCLVTTKDTTSCQPIPLMSLTLFIWHPATEVLLQVCVLVVVDADEFVTCLGCEVCHKAGLTTASGTLHTDTAAKARV